MPLPPLSSLFALSQRNFGQGLTIKAPAQIWKKLHKINEVIDNDVNIARKLAEKTVKSKKLLHLSFNRTETLQKDSPFMLFLNESYI